MSIHAIIFFAFLFLLLVAALWFNTAKLMSAYAVELERIRRSCAEATGQSILNATRAWHKDAESRWLSGFFRKTLDDLYWAIVDREVKLSQNRGASLAEIDRADAMASLEEFTAFKIKQREYRPKDRPKWLDKGVNTYWTVIGPDDKEWGPPHTQDPGFLIHPVREWNRAWHLGIVMQPKPILL